MFLDTSLPGVHTQGATPDPIPNSAVKPLGPMILPCGGKVGQCRAFPFKQPRVRSTRGCLQFSLARASRNRYVCDGVPSPRVGLHKAAMFALRRGHEVRAVKMAP